MKKYKIAIIGLVILALFYAIYFINMDYYSILLEGFSPSAYKTTSSFLFTNMGLYNPLLLPAIIFNINMFRYTYILSFLIFILSSIFMYRKIINKEQAFSKQIVLIAFTLLSTSFIYRTYGLLLMPFIILSFYYLKDLTYKKKLLPLSLSLTALFLSNWVIGIITFLVLILVQIYYIEDDFNYGLKDLIRLFATFLIALGASSLIVFPSMAEGALLPEITMPLSYAVFLIQILIAVKNIKTKQKLLSTILGLVYAILLLNMGGAMLFSIIPYVFIIFRDFLKDYDLDLSELAIFILLFLLVFGLSFEKEILYPLANINYKAESIGQNKIFINAKSSSFLSLTLIWIIAFIELNTIKRFKVNK